MTPTDAQQIADAFPGIWAGVKRLDMTIDGIAWTIPTGETVCDVDSVPHDARAWVAKIDRPEQAGHGMMMLCRQLAKHAIHSKGLVFYRRKPEDDMLTVDTVAPNLPCRVQLLGPLRQHARITVLTRG